MGNICCQQEPNPSRTRRQIVPTQFRNVTSSPNRKPTAQPQFQQQQKMLQDFSYALIFLKRNANFNTRIRYKGFYLHNSFCQDDISQYFNGTLVEQDDKLFPCIVKKMTKEKVESPFQKRCISIQYVLTSYHSSNFIIRNIFYYEDHSHLYLYFDLNRYIHLNQFTNNIFNTPYSNYFKLHKEECIRFAVAGIILAIEELHKLKIVYRGINNENIVITQKGYPMITNLSRLHPEGQFVNLTDTDHFLSPQEYRNQIVTKATDFWALGVLIYYMVTGTYPNFSVFQENQFHPVGVNPSLSDLVNRLLVFNPNKRLGVIDINFLKNHQFFNNFDWKKYSQLQLVSPFTQNETKIIPQEQHHYYNEQCYFDDGSGFRGAGMMATLLFVDIATMFMICQAIQYGQMHNDAVVDSNQQQNLDHDFQQGCTVDIGDSGSGFGGDYD